MFGVNFVKIGFVVWTLELATEDSHFLNINFVSSGTSQNDIPIKII